MLAVYPDFDQYDYSSFNILPQYTHIATEDQKLRHTATRNIENRQYTQIAVLYWQHNAVQWDAWHRMCLGMNRYIAGVFFFSRYLTNWGKGQLCSHIEPLSNDLGSLQAGSSFIEN